MKKLNLLDQSTSFKVNDTGTIIPFNAFENNQPFGVTENETSVFRIKNDMGFLKAVNATSAAGGYIFQLNTKDLVGLVPGTYEIELVITDGETNAELIFPDTGFCSFNITTSALTVTGTQIPTMSLDSFKQQLQQYVQIQADTKIQQIKSDFDTYVESVKQGPAGPQGDPGADGKPASIVVGSTKTGDVGSSASVTNVGTSTNAILNFTIPQGPKGDTGENGTSATINVGTVSSYNSWVAYSSIGKNYHKGYILPDGEHPNSTDIYTDYFNVNAHDNYSVSMPANIPNLSGNQALRIVWYDTNKSALSYDEEKNISFPYVMTKTAPDNASYARVCCSVGNNASADGTNTPIYVSDNGPIGISNSGNENDATLNFDLPTGAMGMQGLQGVAGQQGPTGPEGTIGDYVTGTGWLDLTPYMNAGDNGVWCGWNNNNTTGDIGYCKYAVTLINEQPIFWYRIHSRFRDASIAGKWGTKLFTIPTDIQKQYGGMEQSQYQGGIYECNGQPCLTQLVGDSGSRYVQTRGALQISSGGDNTSKLTGTVTVNMEGWYIL